MTLFIADTCDDEILGGGGGGSGTVTDVTGVNSVETTPGTITTTGTAQLVNDALAPGNDQYYGTDAGGIKGYFPLPAAGAIASLTEDPAPQLNQWQWDNGAGQLGTLILDQKFQGAIHVAKNGDDVNALLTLYQPYSTKVPFFTIEAAHHASTANDIIVVWPGKWTPTSTMTINGSHSRSFYFFPMANVKGYASGENFLIDGAETLNIYGYGQFSIGEFPMFSNSNPSGGLSNLNIECDWVKRDGNSLTFINTPSMNIRIRVNDFDNAGLTGGGYFNLDMGVDNISLQSQNLLYSDDNSGFFFDTNGPSKMKIAGRSTPKAKFTRTSQQAGGLTAAIFMDQGGDSRQRILELWIDTDNVDGYFIVHRGGIIKWHGDNEHKKSGALGNELPLYFADNNSSGVDTKPYLEYWGNAITRPYDSVTPNLNNTIFDIRISGTFILHATSQCSGEDSGIGAFSCVSIDSTDTEGVQEVILDGVYKTGVNADVGPIKINNSGGEVVQKIKFLNVLAICLGQSKLSPPIYTTTEQVTALYVYHSLGINSSIDETVFYNAMSTDRAYVDTDIDYTIQGYQE